MIGIVVLLAWAVLYAFIRWLTRPVIKLDVHELRWWHIEREADPSGFWGHCHEYNFAGRISISLLRRESITPMDFYLSVGRGFKLNDLFELPLKILQERPIIGQRYLFQLRLPHEIEIPKNGYIILRGGLNARRKVKFVAHKDGLEV